MTRMYYELIVFAFYFILICCTSICLRVRCNRHPRNHGEADVKKRKLTGTLFPVISGSLIMFLPEIILWGSWASSLSSFRKELSNERFRNRKKNCAVCFENQQWFEIVNSGTRRSRHEVSSPCAFLSKLKLLFALYLLK